MTNKERLFNISWTIAENYKLNNNPLFNVEDKYTASLWGYIGKYFNVSLLKDYIERFIENLSNSYELKTLLRIILENVIWDDITRERPGTLEFRQDYLKEFKEKINKSKKDKKIEFLETFYDLKTDKIPVCSNISSNLINEIIRFHSYDTFQVIEFCQELFSKYFHINKSLPVEEDKKFEVFIEKEKLQADFRQMMRKELEIDDWKLEKYNIGSAEFTGVEDEEEKRIKAEEIKGQIDLNVSLYEITKKHFGNEALPRFESQKIEREISKGIHKHIEIFTSCGDFQDKNSYFAQEMENSYRQNLEYFNKNKLVFDRASSKLAEVIKNSLLQDLEDEIVKSDSGKIIVKDIWKNKFLNDSRIFEKINKNDSKDLYVDILLDSSASQIDRKSLVTSESYIIAEALSKLNIKTRVVFYNNFYNYLIVRKVKDYNDGRLKNKDIFYYNPTGSNRDGFAIKYMRYIIEKDYRKRNILIILSDGKPNDEINLGLIGANKVKGQDYVKEDAVKDSAKEILLTKLKGIYTFGVFTGEEEDIKSVKKIYGKDFCYINNINRFHEVVGIFLKTFAEKLQ